MRANGIVVESGLLERFSNRDRAPGGYARNRSGRRPGLPHNISASPATSNANVPGSGTEALSPRSKHPARGNVFTPCPLQYFE